MASFPGALSIGASGTLPAATAGIVRCVGAVMTSEIRMGISLSIGPIVALLAGILILIMPRLLNYIIALYLIIIGVLGLMGGDGRVGGRVGADLNETPPAATVQHTLPVQPVGPVVGI